MIVRIDQCRVCGNADLVDVCDFGSMALTGIFPKTADQEIPYGPLELVKCHGNPDRCCGLVQLRHSFSPEILFGGRYGYRSRLNASIEEHLQGISCKIKSWVHLKPGDTVIDIGSNDGTFLRFFSGQGLHLIGVDPTAWQFRDAYPLDACVIPEFFSKGVVQPRLDQGKAKVIAAVSVFYDIHNPMSFLTEIRDILSSDGICVLEQGYLPAILKNNAYDTVCHEHLAFYGLRQIKWLADQVGFKIISCDFNAVNGGSFCLGLSHKDSAFPEATASIQQVICEEDELGLQTLLPYDQFRRNILAHRQALRQTVDSLLARKKSIAGFGASTKGNVLLQFCGLTSKEIAFVAEINEDKWGCFCPGSRIPIISEQEAMGHKPDIFLVLPWHLRQSILAKAKEYRHNGGGLLFPLPKIELGLDA